MAKEDNLKPGNVHGKGFTSENQPTTDAKIRGKKKAALLKNVAKQLVGGGVKEALIPLAEYLEIDIDSIDLEMAMHMKQMELALKKGDTVAYNSVMNRLLGKPKEDVTVTNKKTSIDINIVKGRKK